MKPKPFFGRISLWLRTHYHWVQAAVMFLMIFSFGGASNNLTSLHIIPVTETLGVGRESFSLAMGAKTFAAMLSTFFSGFLITRLGARLSSTLGLLAAGGAYLLLARLDRNLVKGSFFVYIEQYEAKLPFYNCIFLASFKL